MIVGSCSADLSVHGVYCKRLRTVHHLSGGEQFNCVVYQFLYSLLFFFPSFLVFSPILSPSHCGREASQQICGAQLPTVD